MSIEFSGGMTDDERIISTRQLSEDETENSLRPKSMADYIGQKKSQGKPEHLHTGRENAR